MGRHEIPDKQALLALLLDGRWHSYNELRIVYYKYTQRLPDLKRDGYVIETRKCLTNPHAKDYKLIDGPIKPLIREPNGQLLMPCHGLKESIKR